MKKGIRYLRFSSDGQSQHSIERQEMDTGNWMHHAGVHVVDTFTDEGYTARNFDRPDFRSLTDFIKRNRFIDYLVVSELTRFSREAGDAINMVKHIQSTYGIRIVSALRSSIYDVFDHNSFMMMGLEFLLGNSENIKRTNDINGGIYTAKAIKHRWIGARVPYGYKQEGAGNDRRLIIDEEQAAIVQFIFEAYLANTPFYIILKLAKKKGFPLTSNDRLHDMLRFPLYAGYQHVKPFKNNPGGLFSVANVTAIVSLEQWNQVQRKLTPPAPRRTTLSDDFPLRGLLLCHCNKPLTGAPSRSKSGRYIPYYKCHTSGHNNVNADFAHDQLTTALSYMSMPQHLVVAIRDKSTKLLEERTTEDRKQLMKKRTALTTVEKDLISVEEKWIKNQISLEAYTRWHSTYTDQRRVLTGEIEVLSRNGNELQFLLQEELEKLTDLKTVYDGATTLQKQELIRRVFDNSLYYREKVYRTPYVMPIFRNNLLILKQKQLLVLDTTRGKSGEVEVSGFLSNTLTDFLSLVKLIRVA